MGKKLTKEEFMRNVVKKNEHVRNDEIEIRGEFTNTSNRIECYCSKHDVLWSPIADSLYKNIGCRECAKEGISDKNSMTHEEYVEGLHAKNSAIKVLTKYYGMDKDITVKLGCGHLWTTKAARVYYRDFGCPYCSGNAILVGFNDLWTTSKTTAMLLTNSNDGYTLMKNSAKKRSFTCPLCGKSQFKFVNNVSRRGLQCSFCGDGVSYPNKFCRAFLDQLPIDDYEVEWQPDWAKPYFYDNVFSYNGIRYILEADGNLHYSDKNEFGVSLEERQKVDEIKNKLAQEHNIAVIRIDCRESDCNYIKNNILVSELNNIFELDFIDWNQCDAKAQKSLVKTACDLYMSGIKSTEKISKIIKVGRNAVIRYLKKGSEFGWCNYDPQKAQSDNYVKQSIPVTVVHIQSQNCLYFNSIIVCERELPNIYSTNVYQKGIINACKTGEPYNGFYFKFTDLTTQN